MPFFIVSSALLHAAPPVTRSTILRVLDCDNHYHGCMLPGLRYRRMPPVR